MQQGQLYAEVILIVIMIIKFIMIMIRKGPTKMMIMVVVENGMLQPGAVPMTAAVSLISK